MSQKQGGGARPMSDAPGPVSALRTAARLGQSLFEPRAAGFQYIGRRAEVERLFEQLLSAAARRGAGPGGPPAPDAIAHSPLLAIAFCAAAMPPSWFAAAIRK